jgi:hypothetical protein
MNQNKTTFIIGLSLIVLAATMKVATFPHSINPIIAISLFSGVLIKDKKWAFAIPVFAMFVSDLMLEVFNIAPGFYGMGQIGNYASLLFVTVLGFTMKKTNLVSVAGYSIASSLVFFFLSNTNSFLFENASTYGAGLQGWANCLVAGLPFLRNGMAIDLCFSVLLFGTYVAYTKFAEKKQLA